MVEEGNVYNQGNFNLSHSRVRKPITCTEMTVDEWREHFVCPGFCPSVWFLCSFSQLFSVFFVFLAKLCWRNTDDAHFSCPAFLEHLMCCWNLDCVLTACLSDCRWLLWLRPWLHCYLYLFFKWTNIVADLFLGGSKKKKGGKKILRAAELAREKL